ncbi:hypothetical protein [Falsirhodobacter sp. 20TX0035]|uniref:hypothetical protein n=1 Tax=Falsirhodobacter sp. 20TX0035 TaxID=3022019 RepID=UPI00232B3D79|nr:hypothetical protein [Falsirhodobacter sp. 20TX0035]MDB6454361.1 hypothetical protein [Falsirhodobacter sp. 20TX0035]
MRKVALVTVMGLTACASTLPQEVPAAREGRDPLPAPRYLGVQTMRISDDLVGFRVAIERPRAAADIDAYTDCAAAQYALVRGQSYVRRIRTNIDDRGAGWKADAVYLISADRPQTGAIIEAAPTVADCKAQSIPTV